MSPGCAFARERHTCGAREYVRAPVKHPVACLPQRNSAAQLVEQIFDQFSRYLLNSIFDKRFL